MSDEKKLPRSKKELLRQLGVISPLDEIREQVAALTNPLYMAGMREEIAALINPSYSAGMREQIAELTKPSYTAEMREQIAALTKPSYPAEMREQIAALTKPSYPAEMREQIAALIKPSYPAEMREQIAALTKPSYPAEMREQIAALTKPLYTAEMREQISALTKPSYTAEMREQISALINPSYPAEMREQMAAMGSGGWMQAELSAVLGSYQALISGSALASFLVSPNNAGKSPTQVVEVEGFDRLEVGDFAILDVDQAHIVDLEIVKAISEGGAAALSPTAVQRLQSVYLQIVVIWDMLLRIVQTYMAYVFLSTMLTDVSVPAEIKEHVAQLPSHERVLLADYRVVNRDGARLRAGPGTDSEVLVSLRLGMPVEVLEKNDKGWFFVTVEYQGEWIEGWIYLSVTTPIPAPQKLRGRSVDVAMK